MGGRAGNEAEGCVLETLCDDCPFTAAGEMPRCWACDRTRLDDDGREAIEIWQMLEAGMSWDLALAIWRRTWTPDEIHALARRLAIIKQELRAESREP